MGLNNEYYRNASVFREEAVNPVEIFELVKVKAWTWLRAKNSSFIHSFAEWLNEPMECIDDT